MPSSQDSEIPFTKKSSTSGEIRTHDESHDESPEIPRLASVESMEAFARSGSKESIGSGEDLSATRKQKIKKKLGRARSMGVDKKSVRPAPLEASKSEEPKGSFPARAKVGSGPILDHSATGSASGSDDNNSPTSVRRSVRRSINMPSDENPVSGGKIQPATAEQQEDFDVKAARVATVMFMSNAELAKGIRALEKDEVEEVAELYGLFDADKSGALDAIELGSLIRALGFKACQDQIFKVMRWLDEENLSQGRRKGERKKSMLEMVEEKAVEFDAFVQLMLRLRAEGPPALDRKIQRVATVDSKGKPIKQSLVLMDAIERVLPHRGETWPPDGVAKKKLKDADIAHKASEILLELSKKKVEAKYMIESLQSDLMIFKGTLQSKNRKGVQQISNVGSTHHKLKMEHEGMAKQVHNTKEELAVEKEKYQALRNAAVPELAAMEAEVALLKKRVEGWEQRVREDSLCARDLCELQKAKEARIRELAPKVAQCSELQKKCQESSQINVVLKSLLLECCANFDAFIGKKEEPLKHLESCGLAVQKCTQGLLQDHIRINKASVAAPDGVPDPAIPVVGRATTASR